MYVRKEAPAPLHNRHEEWVHFICQLAIPTSLFSYFQRGARYQSVNSAALLYI